MIQREQTLADQRTRNKLLAKSFSGVTMDFEPLQIKVLVENKRSQEPVNLATISDIMKYVMNVGLEQGKDFEVVLAELYDTIAQRYPERDVHVDIFDTEENFTITKFYNHQY